MRKLLFLLLAAVSFTACSLGSAREMSDLEKQNIKGSASLVQTTNLAHIRKNITKEQCYNEHGYLTQTQDLATIAQFEASPIGTIFKYEYQDDGKTLVSIIEYSGERKITIGDGLPKENPNIERKYDSNGNVIGELHYADPDKYGKTPYIVVMRKFDDNNRLVEAESYRNVARMVDGGGYEIIKSTTSKTVYVNNEFGDIVEKTNVKEDGSTINKVTFEYQYDDQNNWVVKWEDGKKSEIRKIEYHGQEPSQDEDFELFVAQFFGGGLNMQDQRVIFSDSTLTTEFYDEDGNVERGTTPCSTNHRWRDIKSVDKSQCDSYDVKKENGSVVIDYTSGRGVFYRLTFVLKDHKWYLQNYNITETSY